VSRRIKLIFNPHADRGRAWNYASALQSIVERRGGASWSATEYPTHATELAAQAAREGFDIVTAVGGDGTVHEVVNGLMPIPEADRPLFAAVPIGSGNDFCSNNGIAEDREEAMHRVFDGETKTIDMGILVDNTGHTEYFDNTVGIQFGAFATLHSHKITRLQGFMMYLWAVIRTIILNHDAPRMTITTDQETIEQEVQYLVLCNGPREGGGFFVAPEAVPDPTGFPADDVPHCAGGHERHTWQIQAGADGSLPRTQADLRKADGDPHRRGNSCRVHLRNHRLRG
jgi:diacylglycerol kinase family enzyme